MPKYNQRQQKCNSCNTWVYPGEGWLMSWPYNHVIHKSCYKDRQDRKSNKINLKKNQLRFDFE